MILFLWMYYQIAVLVWKLRKPISDKYNSNSVTVETSTGISPNEISKISSPSIRRTKSIMKSNKSHVEKKIRTFKIILVTMFVFFLCRMPHWIFNVLRFAMVSADKPIHWIMSYALSFLLLVNTAMNPYLYTFLSQTINYIDKFLTSLGDFISNICCCCCSTKEFQDYESDNSFFKNMQEQRPSQISNHTPRGPYGEFHGKNCHNHVTFDDKAVVNTYPSDEKKQVGYGVLP